MRLAVLFPGQGTQAPGAGHPWRDHPAWTVVAEAAEVLGDEAAYLLLDADAAALARTREAQLAVVLVGLVAWRAVARDLPADAVYAGHSLGQITALVAAGAIDVGTGISLAAARAAHTHAAADANPGRMAALLGATVEQAETACAAAPGACWLANDNAPGQVVIGGTPAGIADAGDAARRLGVRRVTELAVSGAFHTPLMQTAAIALAADLRRFAFRTHHAAVVANTDAVEHDDGDGWVDRLNEHLVHPVQWRASMARLTNLGVDRAVEVGPGGVVAGLAHRNAPDWTVTTIAAPSDLAMTVTA